MQDVWGQFCVSIETDVTYRLASSSKASVWIG